MNFSRLIAVLLVFTLISACKKDSEPNNFVTATINSSAWAADNVTLTTSNGKRKLKGNKSGNMYLEIELEEGATGTIDLTGNQASITYSDGDDTFITVLEGSLTLTANEDGHVEGTFSTRIESNFSGESVNIANGRFRFD